MSGPAVPLWERPELRAAAGTTLRPGGFSLTDRAAGAIGLLPGWRVLDVGCGLGATVARLRSRYGAEAWGVEPSSGQIAGAEGLPGLVRARADSLPFRSQSFDALFCECVLSLLEDPTQGLAECYRVLRPGGFLVLADLFARDGCVSGETSCAARARPLAEVREQLEEQGFSVLLAEDYSRHLRDLAARLIWAGSDEERGCGRRLGYFLMIAQQGETTHAG